MSRSCCFRCRSRNHHTAIYEKEYHKKEKFGNITYNNQNENLMATLLNSRTSVLLQTASGLISETTEKFSHPIKIVLDPGSQRTYLSEKIVKIKFAAV